MSAGEASAAKAVFEPPTEPLSEEEFAELSDFLLSDEVPPHCMRLSMLDGFLTALVVGPREPELARWLPQVWDPGPGRDEPQFDRASDAQRIVELIVRQGNDIAYDLENDPDGYQPLFVDPDLEEGEPQQVEEDGPGPIVDEWCFGFLVGIELDREAWKPLLEARPEWFHELWLYGSEEGWNELEQYEGREASAAAHAERVGRIAPAIRRILAHHRVQRGPFSFSLPAAIEPAQSSKVGRNEPCPCGSGRKYKHCHGAG